MVSSKVGCEFNSDSTHIIAPLITPYYVHLNYKGKTVGPVDPDTALHPIVCCMCLPC
jgi:hypothetical protein